MEILTVQPRTMQCLQLVESGIFVLLCSKTDGYLQLALVWFPPTFHSSNLALQNLLLLPLFWWNILVLMPPLRDQEVFRVCLNLILIHIYMFHLKNNNNNKQKEEKIAIIWLNMRIDWFVHEHNEYCYFSLPSTMFLILMYHKISLNSYLATFEDDTPVLQVKCINYWTKDQDKLKLLLYSNFSHSQPA